MTGTLLSYLLALILYYRPIRADPPRSVLGGGVSDRGGWADLPHAVGPSHH